MSMVITAAVFTYAFGKEVIDLKAQAVDYGYAMYTVDSYGVSKWYWIERGNTK